MKFYSFSNVCCYVAVTLVLLSSLMFWTCSEAYAVTTEDGRYVYTISDDSVYIQSYTGENESVLTIPSYIEGLPVVSVALFSMAEDGNNYKHNTTVKEIVLPETIKRIDSKAFIYFTSLQRVEGLENVKELGADAFVGTTIKSLAFSEKLDVISPHAFSGEEIETITIPDDLKFDFDPVTSPMFYGDFALRHITLIETGKTPTLVKHGEALYTADMKSLLCYPACGDALSYVIPDGVETIAKNAVFSGNGGFQLQHLMDLVVPDSVKNIFRDSFYYNTNIPTPMIRCTNSSYAYEYCQRWDWPCCIVSSTSGVQTIERILSNAVSTSITDQMSDYEKAFALHNWLCNHAIYDNTLAYYEAKDMILRGTGVCQSYLLTYKMLLDRAGLESTYLAMYGTDIPHGTNMVKIGDDWIIVDVTWDDLSGSNEFFGMNNEIASKTYNVSIPAQYGNTTYWYKPYQDGYFDALLQALTERINAQIVSSVESLTLREEYQFDVAQYMGAYSPEAYVTGYTVADRLNEQTWPLPARQVICTYNEDDSLTVLISYQETEQVPFDYQLDNGEICILSYTGTENDVVVPKTINGYPVTSIGDDAFRETSITSIVLPEGMKEVRSRAFYSCQNLRAITFPSTVTDLSGDSILNNCSAIESIDILGNVEKLGVGFAFGCEALTDIHFPDSLEILGDEAFGNCSSLVSVIFPSGLKSVGGSAFIDCKSLSSVTFSEGLETIADQCFWGCENLNEITLPVTLETLGARAFIGTSLAELYIPANVHTIGDINCTAMKKLNVDPENQTYKSVDNLIMTKDGTELITCATGICGVVTIPESVISIDEWALANCVEVTEFVLPNSLREIGAYALNNCQALQKITIPEGVTHLNNLFGNTFALSEINLPDTLKSIGDSAFMGMTRLTSLQIPDSVETLGKELIAYSVGLRSIIIPASVTIIDDHVFDYASLDHIYIHDSVQSIGLSELFTIPTIHATKDSVAYLWAENNGYLFDDTSDDESVRIPGDVNEDGKVDIFDAILIFQYDIDQIADINTVNGNVNGDDACDASDGLLLLQHQAGWSVTLE